MNTAANLFNEIFEPLGLTSRSFHVDYQDSVGNDYNEPLTACPLQDWDDEVIVAGIIELYSSRGFSVTGIYELLDGKTKGEIDMSDNEALSHIRFLYLSPEFFEE